MGKLSVNMSNVKNSWSTGSFQSAGGIIPEREKSKDKRHVLICPVFQ